MSSPEIGLDGTVYVGSNDNNIYALDEKRGELKWKYTTGNIVHTTPMIGLNGLIYITSLDKKLYAICQ